MIKPEFYQKGQYYRAGSQKRLTMDWTYLIFVFIVSVSAGKNDIYEGYTVHGVKIRDTAEQTIVHGFANSHGVDIWSYGMPERDAVLMLKPSNRDEVLTQLDQNGISHYLQVENLADNLDEHDKEVREWKEAKLRSGRSFPFDDYPRYAEIDEYLERIAAQYPDLVTLVNAGQSYEGRDIKYLKISTTNFTDTSKPIYFIEAMLHAREWVTTPVALYSIHRLVEDLRDQDRDLLEDIDWIIHPLVNPDGYEFTHTNARMWRLTRTYRPEVHQTCRGADGNRNFDVAWGSVGASTDPCSDVYMGPEPFSESETRIVRDILHEHIDRIQIFLDIHSFGNLLLFGYGNGSLPGYPIDPVHLFHVSSAMGAAIDTMKLPTASFYVVGNAGILYPTSGTADDYGMKVGVPLSLCLELPGYWFGFAVPPSYIQQINEETWEGIAVTARLARAHYRARL